MESQGQGRSVTSQGGNLGTFAGVFTPSILTILGIILFLRLGFVVGNSGLGRALLIIGLANIIVVLTSISLSAVATNLHVKGGGDYYLISRTLGLEFGGAIGIVLFLAQSISIAFYCIGFAEVLSGFIRDIYPLPQQVIALLAISFIFIFAWMGADWATRFQYVVMAFLFAALASFFWGGIGRWDTALLAANWGLPKEGLGFWPVFAIFFPAVTGFTQGVSMSGDLKDAGKSLPLGTFSAVALSILVYFLVAVIFAATVPLDALMADYSAMYRVSSVNFLIDAGVIAATLSSAMASFMGAPRILQSMARDRIFPLLRPFAHGEGPASNPRRGVLLSCGIAFLVVGLGNLNLVASIVTMFFLVSYGLLNYATFYEARAASPSFRPTFRWFDSRVSLMGALSCLAIMLAVNLYAGIIAISILLAIHQYLKRVAHPARWADSRRSYHMQLVREHILAAAGEAEHPRDWRPQLLAFSDDPHRREQLLRFASWIEGSSGLTTAVRVLEGTGLKMIKQQQEAEKKLQEDINALGLKAFPLVVIAPSLEVGVHTLVQAFGVGPLRANTILLNWFEKMPHGVLGLHEAGYGQKLKMVFRLGSNIVILDAMEEEWTDLQEVPPNERRIDVWWWDDATSRLMLLLAYLMTRKPAWEHAAIRLLGACYQEDSEENRAHLASMLSEVRIDAESKIVPQPDARAVMDNSADASLVYFPFRLAGNHMKDPFGNSISALLPGLPVSALVLAAEDIVLDADPEDGPAAEIASILDAIEDAHALADKLEKDAAEAALEVEKIAASLAEDGIIEGGEGVESGMHAELKEAKKQEQRAMRRAAKARAKAEIMAREVEASGGSKEGEKEEAAGDGGVR